MRREIALLGLIACICYCPDVFAAAVNEEVIVHPSLVMLGPVVQEVSLSYGYTSHTSGKRGSSSQELGEGYGIATQAAVWDPNILLLDISAGVTYQQHLGNSKTSVLDWNYNILGSAFQLSYHPTQMATTRSTSTISNGYMPSYSLERTINRLTASLLHESYPVTLFLANSTVATHGLATDSTSDSNNGGITVSHSGSNWSGSAMMNFSNSHSGATETRNYSLLQNSTFDFDSEKKYRLATRASLSDSTSESPSGSLPQRNVGLSASFTGRPGKALTTTLTDEYTYSSAVGLEGDEQVIKTNVFSGVLAHRLYQSLTTSVSASYGQTSALGGDQSVVNGNLALSYTKVLPALSQLALTASVGKSVTKQNFLEDRLSARDEAHTVQQRGDIITPNLAGQLVQVTTVKSLGPPEFVYQPEIDYHVDLATGRIEVLATGTINPGTTLYITYEVVLNPNVDFTTDTQNYQAALGLLNGRYNLVASYGSSQQQKTSGVAASALNDTSTLLLSGEARYEASSYNVEYGKVTTTGGNVSHVAGACAYESNWGTSSRLKLTARNTYSVHERTSDGASTKYNQNVISASASYSQKVLEGFRLVMVANASDSRMDNVASDAVGLRAGLDGSYNSLTLSFAAGTVYRFGSGETMQDNYVNAKISRIF